MRRSRPAASWWAKTCISQLTLNLSRAKAFVSLGERQFEVVKTSGSPPLKAGGLCRVLRRRRTCRGCRMTRRCGMQSLHARRRVESGGRGDQRFRFSIWKWVGWRGDCARRSRLGTRRVRVRRATQKKKSEAKSSKSSSAKSCCGGAGKSCPCSATAHHATAHHGATTHHATSKRASSRTKVRRKHLESAPTAGEPKAACGVCGECAAAADGAAAGDHTQRGGV